MQLLTTPQQAKNRTSSLLNEVLYIFEFDFSDFISF